MISGLFRVMEKTTKGREKVGQKKYVLFDRGKLMSKHTDFDRNLGGLSQPGYRKM